MSTNTHLAATSILLATMLLLPSCNYKFDTVSFDAVGKTPPATTPVPKIEIDTNMSVGSLMGGSVKSKMPYDIRAHYMDDTFTFCSALIHQSLTVLRSVSFRSTASRGSRS